MITAIQPEQYVFADDGQFPNSYLPVLVYRKVIPAHEVHIDNWFEVQLRSNNWLGIWRNGILSYNHYHSSSHEVLCVYKGWADVLLGGPKGEQVRLEVGDVVIIPAGVAHNNRWASADFAVMGAYPDGRTWDLLTGEAGERPVADETISQLPLPDKDPFYDSDGPLTTLWKTNK